MAIMRALQAIAGAAGADSKVAPYRAIVDSGARFCALKPDTAAYVNAVRWTLANLNEQSTVEDINSTVARRVEAYSKYRQVSLARIVNEACGLLRPASRILIHDYSSTVMAVISEAGRRNLELSVYVTAGEPVNQGSKVAKQAAGAGHKVVYLPDAAIGRVMDELDLVLIGVETLFSNGDLANTIGTYPLALAAGRKGVPVYGVTERMKIQPTAAGVSANDLRARVLSSLAPRRNRFADAVISICPRSDAGRSRRGVRYGRRPDVTLSGRGCAGSSL